MNVVTKSIDAALAKSRKQDDLAKQCRVTSPALMRWYRLGRFPRTDHTGETDYAGIIAKVAGCKREELIKASEIVWRRNKR